MSYMTKERFEREKKYRVSLAIAKNLLNKEMIKRAEKHKPKSTGGVYPFTGIIRCENCGAHYNRKISNCSNKYRRVFWNCSTFLNKGKAECHTKQIPEEDLYRLSCEVLGIPKFDEEIFKDKIK